ncbi:hypothetical protein CRUP_028926, partial [Coryphaenoides rupestris]
IRSWGSYFERFFADDVTSTTSVRGLGVGQVARVTIKLLSRLSSYKIEVVLEAGARGASSSPLRSPGSGFLQRPVTDHGGGVTTTKERRCAVRSRISIQVGRGGGKEEDTHITNQVGCKPESVLQFTEAGCLETVWQVKFYNYNKRDHCQWGNSFSSIEYECKPNDTRTLMWINKEIPDQTRPDWTRPDHTKPDQTGPDHTRPHHTTPDHTTPDGTRLDQELDRTGLFFDHRIPSQISILVSHQIQSSSLLP